MANLNICEKLVSGNVRTAKGRLAWCFLDKPDSNRKKKAKDGSEKQVYKTAIFFPPTADLSVLKAEANAAAIEEFGLEKVQAWVKAEKFNTPFLDGRKATRTERNPDGWEWADGWICVRADTGDRPGVVEANGISVGDDYSGVYSGRWGRLTLRAKAYPAIDGGKPGVKFYLSNVQLLDHDERLGGGRASAEDEFESVDVAGGAASTDSVFGNSGSVL